MSVFNVSKVASVKLTQHSTDLKKMIRVPAAFSIALQFYINIKKNSAFLVPRNQNWKNVLIS